MFPNIDNQIYINRSLKYASNFRYTDHLHIVVALLKS